MSHTSRWTAQKISQRIKLIEPLVYREKQPLPPYQILQYNDAQATSVVPPDIENGDWETIRPNEYWGGRNISFTLRTQFKIPADWRAETPIALSLPIGDAGDFSHPEAMVFIDGTPYAACDRHHQEVILGEEFKKGQTHQLVLHGWSGINLPDYQRLQMNPCYLVNIDQPTRDFIVMSRVALGAAEILDADEPAKGFLLNALDDAFKSLDTREPFGDAFYQSVLEAYAVLKNGIVRSGRSLEVEIFAVGHAHIDVAWLWTLDQTRGKAGRTFYNVIRLMGGWEMGTHWWDVGGGGLQHQFRRIPGPPVLTRARFLPPALWRQCRIPGTLASRCFRIRMEFTSDHGKSGDRIFLHYQNRLEPI
jgi:alpha-mannosidase